MAPPIPGTMVFSSFLLLLCLSSFPTPTSGFRYQTDTSDDCSEHLAECTTSPTRWFQCPISCNEPLHDEGSMFEVLDDPQQIFSEVSVTRSNGKTLSLEDFEGYITIYAMIPLLPGMSQFYYELLEHVQTVYPYTVQTLIQPSEVVEIIDDNGDTETVASTTKITPHDADVSAQKTIVLQSTSQPTQMLDYLMTARQVAGNPNVEFKLDRVTIWLISADGMYIERLNAPSMVLLERRLAVFLKQLAWTPESEL